MIFLLQNTHLQAGQELGEYAGIWISINKKRVILEKTYMLKRELPDNAIFHYSGTFNLLLIFEAFSEEARYLRA